MEDRKIGKLEDWRRRGIVVFDTVKLGSFLSLGSVLLEEETGEALCKERESVFRSVYGIISIVSAHQNQI
jgi:hypothetical protein